MSVILIGSTPSLCEAVAGLVRAVRRRCVIDAACVWDHGVALVRSSRPTVLLLDGDLRDGNSYGAGYAAARLVRGLQPRCCTALFAADFSRADHVRAQRAGICVLIRKRAPRRQLQALLRELLGYAAELRRGAAIPELPGLLRLTPRELEITAYLGAGFIVKEIADLLGLSPKTVDVHKTNLMAKLDIHDRATLARFAECKGLVPSVARTLAAKDRRQLILTELQSNGLAQLRQSDN